MKVKPPKIDRRLFEDIEDELHGLVPHYTPEWAASDEKDPGVALIKIFSHMTENIIHRLNQTPQKNFVAFLDMLGIKRLPAQSARVPVTFMLAKGSDREILIPERTQVSSEKTDEHEELPFETEANLMATPSQLMKVYGIDPFNDRIYEPPQDFLDMNSKSKTSATYRVISLASKSTKNFQLDHVTDLKEKDILKISDSSRTEYVIVSSITATIIKTEDKLEFNHSPDTRVEKIVKFNPFEGKDRQEHILYLGHKDLFNIKGKAQFNLQITNRAGTETEVTHLDNFAWEYWGESKEEGTKDEKNGDDWYELGFIDHTEGFAKNGIIELNKTKEGEIKEKEINGIKSRWIRCKLKDKLAVDVLRKLPELDNIVFTIRSAGEDLAPDLVFHNDTPLDLGKAFMPFGNEPRTFDNFAIGSKEIFSKKEANIELNVKVDPGRTVGASTSVLFDNDKKIYVFARGSFGRLVEIEINLENKNKDYTWMDRGFPPNTIIAAESTPSAIIHPSSSNAPEAGSKLISVFVRGDNGHLIEGLYEKENGKDEYKFEWKDWGSPNKNKVFVNSDPAAICNTTISVFVIGSDNSLYEFNSEKGWIDHIRGDKLLFDSSPYAVSYNTIHPNIVRVFLKGKDDGQLYQLRCQAGDPRKNFKRYEWIDVEPMPDRKKLSSKPFAWVSKWACSVIAFVKGDDNHLWEYDSNKSPNWNDRGQPRNVMLDSAPHGYIYQKPQDPAGTIIKKYIFIRGKDDFLYEFNDEEQWVINHQLPIKLLLSPFVLNEDIPNGAVSAEVSGENSKKMLHVFSATSQNRILERFAPLFEPYEGPPWVDYKDPDEAVFTPVLSWQYWNSKGWTVLKDVKDETSNLLMDGKITIKLPVDVEETEIAGQKTYWIRARIVGGDYGKETFVLLKDPKNIPGLSAFKNKDQEQVLSSTKNTIRPPLIKKVTISYSFKENKDPQYCLTYNNLEYIDQTEASKIPNKFFTPFVQLEDTNLSIYLGFGNILKGGPLRIFFAAKELPFAEENKPIIEWAYSLENGWNELKGHSDSTEGLIKSDIFEFAGPPDFSMRPRFGNPLFWIKGALIKGNYEKDSYPLLDGIYPNTTWAFQEETIRDEILGSSSGLPDQVFALLRLPVLEGEEIHVREILTEQEIQDINENHEKDKLKPIFEVKDETGKVIENWVLWKHVSDFFDSSEKDRHYMLDQTTGKIQFGNGTKGMIPPPGDNNIKAFSYQIGGGSQGNIKTGEIKSIKSSVPGVDKVLNFAAADGGADAAPLDQMLEIGPAMIGHRNRAVTWEDFEWLAKKGSRKIAKVKCLPNRSNRLVDKEHVREIGWVTLIIVPDEKVPQPTPSLELKRKVRKYVANHCVNTLAFAQHIWVDGPAYVEISVSVDVFVTSIDLISVVERDVKEKLDEFFHPLTGGPENKGWEFGRDVNISDIYALIGEIDGVDHAENLRLEYGGSVGKEGIFCWNEIPGEDDERLIKYLKQNFDLDWVETANIRNSDHLNISLFGWDEFFSKDNRRLIEFLIQNFNAGWVRNANIDKRARDKGAIKIFNEKNCLFLKMNDDKSRIKVIINDIRGQDLMVKEENGKLIIKTRTIRISNGEHFLLLKLSNDETKVYLMIDDGRIDEFAARNENGKLNIYSKDIVEIKQDFLVANGKHTINTQVINGSEYYVSS